MLAGHTFSLWHTCRHFRRLLAAVVDVDSKQGRDRALASAKGKEVRPSLASSRYKSSFPAACREKKWRYDDAPRYALCIHAKTNWERRWLGKSFLVLVIFSVNRNELKLNKMGQFLGASIDFRRARRYSLK